MTAGVTTAVWGNSIYENAIWFCLRNIPQGIWPFRLHNILYNFIQYFAQSPTCNFGLECEQISEISDFDLIEVGDDSHHVAAAENWKSLLVYLFTCFKNCPNCKSWTTSLSLLKREKDTSNKKDKKWGDLLVSFLAPVRLWTSWSWRLESC